MSSLPPLPPKDNVAAGLKRREHKLQNAIKNGEDGAEEDYKSFLIEHGRYFYSLEEILPPDQIGFYTLSSIVKEHNGKKRNDYARYFKRSKVPTYLAQGGRLGVQEFVTTKKKMVTDDMIASLESKGHSSNAKKKIWNVDIFARPWIDAQSSEVAHLLPDAPAHAVEWYDVACWAIAEDPEKTDWGTMFRLLHGTKGSDRKRVFGSGLRHFAANKARINGQEKVLDKEDPQLIILPIQDAKQCRDWNGEAYEAIVLVGSNKSGGASGQEWATKEIGLSDYSKIDVFEATPADLNKALQLLEEFTLAMVQSLVNYDPPEVPVDATDDEKKSMNKATKLRNERIESFLAALDALAPLNSTGQPAVPVPRRGNNGPTAKYRAICKIRFGGSEGSSRPLHPAPDPMLLIARATVVWSVRHQIRLRASAVAEDDGEVEWENDVLQFEFMAKLKHAKQLQEKVEGGLTVEQRELQDSSSVTSSVSSGGSYSFPHAMEAFNPTL